MFSTVKHFQMFKPGSVALQIQTREPIKNLRAASDFSERPRLEITKDTVHIKNMQSNKVNMIQHTARAFYRQHSDGTPFVIIHIFIGKCNLITHSFSVTVTDYNSVISLHVTSYSPTLTISLTWTDFSEKKLIQFFKVPQQKSILTAES